MSNDRCWEWNPHTLNMFFACPELVFQVELPGASGPPLFLSCSRSQCPEESVQPVRLWCTPHALNSWRRYVQLLSLCVLALGC